MSTKVSKLTKSSSPILKDDRHDMRIAIQRDAVHRQRRQEREVPGPPRSFPYALVRLVVAVVAAS